MLTSKLIEGEFPNFQKVIPQEFSSELTIKPVELRDALESVGVVAKAGTGRVIFTVANGSLNLEASAGGTGTAHASVTLLDSAGTVDRFAMNYAYLLDAVKAFSGSVQLKGSGSEMPFMLCSQAKPNLYAVVMPMHLN
jgi:DNA polymerase-3 subunit beta